MASRAQRKHGRGDANEGGGTSAQEFLSLLAEDEATHAYGEPSLWGFMRCYLKAEETASEALASALEMVQAGALDRRLKGDSTIRTILRRSTAKSVPPELSAALSAADPDASLQSRQLGSLCLRSSSSLSDVGHVIALIARARDERVARIRTALRLVKQGVLNDRLKGGTPVRKLVAMSRQQVAFRALRRAAGLPVK